MLKRFIRVRWWPRQSRHIATFRGANWGSIWIGSLWVEIRLPYLKHYLEQQAASRAWMESRS